MPYLLKIIVRVNFDVFDDGNMLLNYRDVPNLLGTNAAVFWFMIRTTF